MTNEGYDDFDYFVYLYVRTSETEKGLEDILSKFCEEEFDMPIDFGVLRNESYGGPAGLTSKPETDYCFISNSQFRCEIEMVPEDLSKVDAFKKNIIRVVKRLRKLNNFVVVSHMDEAIAKEMEFWQPTYTDQIQPGWVFDG